jgi:hypothetical protein
MSRFHEKAEGHTKHIIVQRIGDELLVIDGKQQLVALARGVADQHSDHEIVKDEKPEKQPKGMTRALDHP